MQIRNSGELIEGNAAIYAIPIEETTDGQLTEDTVDGMSVITFADEAASAYFGQFTRSSNIRCLTLII